MPRDQPMTPIPTPNKDVAYAFLEKESKRNHAVVWGKDELEEDFIMDTCAAFTHDGRQILSQDDSKCTCGATRHNALCDIALRTLRDKKNKP
jgi:hypothetical protein